MHTGFLFSLFKNDWQIAPIDENPWLGPTAAALRESGASCSACFKSGQWWRLFSAVIMPAGATHLISTMALVSVSAVITARTGLGPAAFCSCMLISAVAGSATTALTAPKTINSASFGLASSAIATAVASVLSIRRLVESWVPVVALLAMMLLLLVLSSLPPLVDTWGTLAGALAGGLCATAVMAPFTSRVRQCFAALLFLSCEVVMQQRFHHIAR